MRRQGGEAFCRSARAYATFPGRRGERSLRLSSPCDRILFPQREENDVTDLMERCARLPRAQFEIVSDIVNRYPVGIAFAARQGR